MIDNAKVRMGFANAIQNCVDDPDYWYNGETEPTENLINYLKEHNVPIPKLPDDIERRKDTVKLMVRVWSSIEAINLINGLTEE